MKKTLILAILALTMNSFAQKNQLDFNVQATTTDLKHLYDSTYSWKWDTLTSEWTIKYRFIEFAYDQDYNLLSKLRQDLDGSNWVISELYSYTYDENNNRISFLLSKWSGSAWENFQQSFYTYDEDHNQTSAINQKWENGEWKNVAHYIFSFDNHNNLVQRTNQYWDSLAWKNDYQFIYSYLEIDSLSSTIWQFWIDTAWENYSRHLYTYDTNFNLINDLRSGWEGTDWQDDVNYIYTYNSDNKCISEFVQILLGSWENWLLVTFTYDINNDISNELHQVWRTDNWEDAYQYFYTYDNSHNPLSSLSQNWEDTAWVNYSSIYQSYDAYNWTIGYSYLNYDDFGATIESGDSSHYYSSMVVNINEKIVEENIVKVYPNPSNGFFRIKTTIPFKSFEVFNLNGEQVYSSNIFNHKTSFEIDLSGKGKGVYFIKIHDGLRVYSKKLILE